MHLSAKPYPSLPTNLSYTPFMQCCRTSSRIKEYKILSGIHREREKKKECFCFFFFLNSEQPIHLVVICLYSLYSMFPAKKKPRDYLFFMFPVPPAYPSSFFFLCYHHLINIVPAERAFQDFHPINRILALQNTLIILAGLLIHANMKHCLHFLQMFRF